MWKNQSVPLRDEALLTMVYPHWSGKDVGIVGSAVAVHFAKHTQRGKLLKKSPFTTAATCVLPLYRALATSHCGAHDLSEQRSQTLASLSNVEDHYRDGDKCKYRECKIDRRKL